MCFYLTVLYIFDLFTFMFFQKLKVTFYVRGTYVNGIVSYYCPDSIYSFFKPLFGLILRFFCMDYKCFMMSYYIL